MGSKSKVLKLLTLVTFVGFFIVILIISSNDCHSYYYDKVRRKVNGDHLATSVADGQTSLQSSGGDVSGLLYDDTFTEYKNQEPTDDEFTTELELTLPNVPFAYQQRHINRTMQKGKNCALFPNLRTLKFYNNYWQSYTNSNITMQLYGAYYDERPEVAQGPVIRILAMINQLKGSFPITYCQMWYENEEKPEIVAIKEYKAIWKFGGSNMFFPFLIACTPPKTSNRRGPGRVPQAVALVSHQCYISTNMLKVIYNKPETAADKSGFAICVKGLDFPYADISFRLVEWLELHRLMGVNKVYMHDIALHPNVRKVLALYQTEGFVDLKPITLVGGVVMLPHIQHWMLSLTKFNKRLNELIPYNDCFYRHMYMYDYIALVDVDEVIMPLGELKTWHDIVAASRTYAKSKNCSQGFAGLCFRNTYYPFDKSKFTLLPSNDSFSQDIPSAPDFMFMLNHKYRTSNYSQKGHATKCLHRTTKTLTLHNHYAVEWMKSCEPFNFPETVAHMQHYHDITPDNKFNAVVAEHTVERFRDLLIARTARVLRQVGLIKQ